MQTSTRAVHMLRVSGEQGWGVPEAPIRTLSGCGTRRPCCLAAGSVVDREGVWSIVRRWPGAQGVHGTRLWGSGRVQRATRAKGSTSLVPR